MDIIPDSIEYAVGAQRFATLGHFNLAINGATYPSRYPPWFPVMILSPLYRLFPTHMGVGIFAILAFGLLAMVAAYAIGYRLSGEWGGVVAALLLLQIPTYISLSHIIMSDVPFFALGMLGAWLFLTMWVRPAPSRGQWLAAALITVLTCAIRPVGAATLLPFLWLALRRHEWRRGLMTAAALCLPFILLLLATGVYDQIHFGHWSRTGYHYWDPHDYEFPGVTFSTAYLPANVDCLLGRRALAVLLVGMIGAGVLAWKRVPSLRPMLVYVGLAALPITVFHLFYKFTDLRFHLLLFGLSACLGGAGLAALLPQTWTRMRWGAAAFALVVGALMLWHQHPPGPPQRRLLADAIAASTPRNAVIITSLEPVYLEPWVQRGTTRDIIPVDPVVQYGLLTIAPHPMPVHLWVHPSDWTTRKPYYKQLWGWHRVIPWTAQERPDLVAALVRGRNPVYLCLSPNDPRWAFWRGLFHLSPVNASVARMSLKNPKS